MRILNEEVDSWLRSGVAVELPVALGNKLLRHVGDSFPWQFSSLDWERIGGRHFVFSELTSDILFVDKVSSMMPGDSHLIYLYGIGDCPVVCPIEFGIKNVDVAFWKAPGNRFMFGARKVEGEFLPSLTHLIQFDGEDGLIFMYEP